MAAANLDTNKVTAEMNKFKAITPTALDGTDGGEYTVTAANDKMFLIITNVDSSNAENVTVKAPAHPLMGTGTGMADMTISVAASTTVVALIDALRFADAETAKIKITGSADVKISVVQM